MRTFVFLLAPASGDVAGGGGGTSFLLMMVLVFVVMWFFMIRPQQKRQKELRRFRESLQKGDKVVTSGGIYGTIVEIKDNYILVEVDQNVRLRFDKSCILKDMTDVPAK
ncbi:MAG: preprotein translocase subunit YajC [Prevotellaceae bacterium]|jgi:preprotein translocase subunit YajC|nr:preprotein translocase subunit YajC [Prevotellaceae bacterium]